MRLLRTALRVASVPIGVGVGVWTALLTSSPSLSACSVVGLGTRALCAAMPRFDPRFCVLCGAVATAFVVLVSLDGRSRASRVWIVDLAAAAAGIGIGLWTSLIAYAPCGPHDLCIGFVAPRFAAWQSAVIGAAALMVIVVVGALVNDEFRRVNVGAARAVQHWLFRDLSMITRVGGPTSPVG
jgi:hypothetical protein